MFAYLYWVEGNRGDSFAGETTVDTICSIPKSIKHSDRPHWVAAANRRPFSLGALRNERLASRHGAHLLRVPVLSPHVARGSLLERLVRRFLQGGYDRE